MLIIRSGWQDSHWGEPKQPRPSIKHTGPFANANNRHTFARSCTGINITEFFFFFLGGGVEWAEMEGCGVYGRGGTLGGGERVTAKKKRYTHAFSSALFTGNLRNLPKHRVTSAM